jgi:hypothetical protein
MSAFMHSAVSFGTPDMPPPGVGRSIGPISLHNAIEDGFSEVELPLCGVLGSSYPALCIAPLLYPDSATWPD